MHRGDSDYSDGLDNMGTKCERWSLPFMFGMLDYRAFWLIFLPFRLIFVIALFGSITSRTSSCLGNHLSATIRYGARGSLPAIRKAGGRTIFQSRA
jgi:hypothetical protein